MRISRRQWVLAIVATIAPAIGCGTILHPERRGQPAGRLDWGVVLLDGLGLIFFLIPGLIAFAVDFATGAIYLPPEYSTPGVPLVRGKFKKLQSSQPRPSMAEVEALVSAEVKQPIKLTEGEYVSEPLSELDDFWVSHQRWLDQQANS